MRAGGLVHREDARIACDCEFLRWAHFGVYAVGVQQALAPKRVEHVDLDSMRSVLAHGWQSLLVVEALCQTVPSFMHAAPAER